MAAGSTFEGQLLNAILCGKTITNVTATAGSTILWVALHTADPSSGTGQNQSEVGLTGYTRVSVDRSTGATGWTVSGSGPATATLNTAASFPQLTSTSTGTAGWCSVGTSSSGVGQILISATISPTIALGANIIPQITTSSSLQVN